MAEIVLTTLNAKYIHASFGLRYLLANLGELQSRACLAEFDINQRPIDIAEALLARDPKIVGFGIYIWNVAPTTEVVAAIKAVRPDVIIVLGGPEVSYEEIPNTKSQIPNKSQEANRKWEGALPERPIIELADYVITGEADLKFAEVCRELLGETRCSEEPLERREPDAGGVHKILTRREPDVGGAGLSPGGPGRNQNFGVRRQAERDAALAAISEHSNHPKRRRAALAAALHKILTPKIIPAELPDFSQLVLPYDLYDDQDVAHRIIYVEASRGCPFTCEFCLSSLDIPVRQVPLPALLGHLQRLLDRGVKQFKFVDRTFNLNVNVSRRILEFFLERYQPGHFFHFEMIPDRLPEALREIITKFPPGALQFEVGIQTFNEEVGALIKRRQNYQRLEENLRFLLSATGVHVHADLIAGLPGETVESFAAGFDRLVALGPQEIQVGILKRLRGTPIVRHDTEWQMVYNPHPPYEILQTKMIDFATMQKLRRFARYWDLVGNSGNFVETTPLIWNTGPGPFWAFMRWSEWLHGQVRRTDSIALVHLMELLFKFLTSELNLDGNLVAEVLWRDYQRGGRRDKPQFLKEFLLGEALPPLSPKERLGIPKRQARRRKWWIDGLVD